jgi:hypothetical protein
MKNTDLVVINLDRPRFLRFGHKALKMLMSMTDIDITKFDMSNFKFEDIEKVYYVGLLSDAKENGETLKLEDMEDLLDLAEFKDVVLKMQEAFEKSFGEVPAEVNEKNEKRVAKK